MNETLLEYCDSRGVPVRVDRTAGVIRGVKILGLRSRNGREYLPEALGRAAALYEGAKVNVNHPKGSPVAPRDYQDRIGIVRGVEVRAGEGLFGDLHFNPKHTLAEQLIWDAEHAPENVGFSHNVQARTARRDDLLVVEEITRVQSVDLVADPATTRGLYESADRPEAAVVSRSPDRDTRATEGLLSTELTCSPAEQPDSRPGGDRRARSRVAAAPQRVAIPRSSMRCNGLGAEHHGGIDRGRNRAAARDRVVPSAASHGGNARSATAVDRRAIADRQGRRIEPADEQRPISGGNLRPAAAAD